MNANILRCLPKRNSRIEFNRIRLKAHPCFSRIKCGFFCPIHSCAASRILVFDVIFSYSRIHSFFRWHAKRFIATYYDIFLFSFRAFFFIGIRRRRCCCCWNVTEAYIALEIINALKLWCSRSMSTFVILSRKLFCLQCGPECEVDGLNTINSLYLIHCEWVWTLSDCRVYCVFEHTQKITSHHFVVFYHLFNQTFDERDKKWCASDFSVTI